MEKTQQSGQKVSLGEAPTLQPLSRKQVLGMVSADIQRMYSLLDCIYKDPLVYDAVVDGLHRRYENLREQQALAKNGDLFKKPIDEETE